MTRQNRDTRTFRRGPTRDTFWISAGLVGAQVVAANTIVMITIATNAQLAAIEDALNATIVRTRGWLHLTADAAVTAETQMLYFGIKLVNENARAIGVTAVPDPFAFPDSDWFVWEHLAGAGSLTDSQGQVGFGKQIDSKAMRKINGGDSLIAVATNLNTSHGLSFTFGIHLLMKSG